MSGFTPNAGLSIALDTARQESASLGQIAQLEVAADRLENSLASEIAALRARLTEVERMLSVIEQTATATAGGIVNQPVDADGRIVLGWPHATGSVVFTFNTEGGPPPGWLACDGTQKQAEDYPELFAVIGQKFGGTNTRFAVPSTTALAPLHANGQWWIRT